MAEAIKKYNPGFLTDQALVDSFCVRTAEFKMIVEALRESTGNSNPHLIVIGPRGAGKTTLLLRVAIEVKRDPALKSAWFPIVFAEESYEVATCGEFWLQCLSNLADQAPLREEAPDLRLTFEELQTVQDDRILADRCLATLMDFADNECKRLVLIVENLNTLFDDISDSDVGWQLRKALQDEPRIFLIGSATSRFEEIDNSSRALYDLFQVHTLQRLNTEACATLWKNVSEQDIGMRSIRPLEILTGGNPRLLAIVALFGARQSFRELMNDMLALVDDHTEYFRSHLESLAPQERRVYLALAALWKPSTTKQVSVLARLPTSQCSALLGRLVDRGAVLRSGGTPRRQEYYLAERMYNIYYLLRKSRGTDHMVEALVRFMTSYYSPSELTDLRERISSEATDADDPTRKLIQSALRLLPSPILSVGIASRGHLETHFQPGAAVETSFLHITQDSKTESAIQCDPDAVASQAGDLVAQAEQLLEDERYDQAIKVCDEIETRFGEVNSLKAAEHVANAAVIKSVSLGRLNRPDDAIAVCNELLNRYNPDDSPDIIRTIATALANKVALLGRLDRHEEVLAACEAFADRFESRDSSATAKDRVHVLYNKGAALAKLGRLERASAVFDGLISHFESYDSVAVRETVVRALLGKGELLDEQHRPEDACATYDAVVNCLGSGNSPKTVEVVAQAMLRKGGSLRDLNRFEEALEIYNIVADRFGSHDSLTITELVAMAQLNKGIILDLLNRPEDAQAAYDTMIDRFGSDDSPEITESVVTALVNKGNSLARSNQAEKALSTYDAAVDRYGGSQSQIVVEMVRRALMGRAAAELTLGRPVAAAATAGRALEGFDLDASEIHVTCQLIRAEAYFNSDNQLDCEIELAAMLQSLPSMQPLPAMSIAALIAFTIRLGPQSILRLIEESPSASHLYPLVTALRQELRIESKVAKEVEEVVKDIRRQLDSLRQAARTSNKVKTQSRAEPQWWPPPPLPPVVFPPAEQLSSMSEFIATQIPKPRDEQAFERCNEVLWRCILMDKTVQMYGRGGQKQYGVDLTGIRDDAPDRIVGVQCKLKSDGKQLTETEVRGEIKKALTFRPLLSEYIIVTTAPDDANLHSLAHELSISASKSRGMDIKIRILGWGSLERELLRHPMRLKPSIHPTHHTATCLSRR